MNKGGIIAGGRSEIKLKETCMGAILNLEIGPGFVILGKFPQITGISRLLSGSLLVFRGGLHRPECQENDFQGMFEWSWKEIMERFYDIDSQVELTLSDHFLENGILQLDYETRPFFSHARDNQVVDFVLENKVIGATYRKEHAYFLCLELKDVCDRLGLEAGAKLKILRRHSDPRRFYLVFSASQKKLQAVLDSMVAERDLPPFEAEFSWPEDKEILNSLEEALTRKNENTAPKGSEVLECFMEMELFQNLEQCDLIGLQGLESVEHFPHQLRTVRKVLFECAGRALLADEVGLGKTVEAGIILREYILRKQVKSVLVLTPASLTGQWQSELEAKFGYDMPVITMPGEVSAAKMSIISLDLAKSRNFKSLLLKNSYDLVIVDEAHKLKNRKTLNYRFVKALSSRFLLLLTATPIQNDLVELYNLMHLVAPGSLGTLDQFRKRFIHPVNKKLPINPELLKKYLASHMIRNSRMETQLQLPPRRVVLRHVEAAPKEMEIYNKLTSFVRDHYYLVSRSASGINQLTLMLLQKLASSSPSALRDSLFGICEKDDLHSDMKIFFEDLANECDALGQSTKMKVVLEYLENELSKDKTIIFTQFRSTQRALYKILTDKGIDCALFHGEMNAKKKASVVEGFRKEAQVLISTDCGAEGWNMQFARAMINFDLPWNPMKVEQRIGRIHRLGQKDDVLIINLCLKSTIEEHIVELLSTKIRLFERVVGELEMILGYMDSKWKAEESMERKIMEVIVKYADPEEQRRELEKIGKGLLKASKTYEHVKEAQEKLLGTDQI